MSMRISAGLLFLALAAGAAAPASAQSFFPTINGYGFSSDDYEYMNKAAASLYEAPQPQVGDQATWENPKSGAAGRVRVGAVDHRCVTLDHAYRSKKVDTVHRLTVKRCRAADGTWKLDFSEPGK